MKPPCISPCKLACFPWQHHFNEKLQRKAPHLRASGSIYAFNPKGRGGEANVVLPFYPPRKLDGSGKPTFTGNTRAAILPNPHLFLRKGAPGWLRPTAYGFPRRPSMCSDWQLRQVSVPRYGERSSIRSCSRSSAFQCHLAFRRKFIAVSKKPHLGTTKDYNSGPENLAAVVQLSRTD